jgi:hypothetical protein
MHLHIPTNIEPKYMVRRSSQEEVVYKAYLDSYIYGYHYGDRYNKNQPLTLRFSDDLESAAEIIYRLQSLDGHIYQEGFKLCSKDTVIEMAHDFPLFNGPHHLALLPHAEDYYIKKLRFERLEPFYIVRTPYSQASYGNIESRKKEALEDASGRRNAGFYSEIAKAALQKWGKIDLKNLQDAAKRIQERQNGSISDLLGLLCLLLRFGRKKGFPKDLKGTLRSCIQEYRYWNDEPGNDLMDFKTESQQILFHTCEILAGQFLPQRLFRNNGKKGRWHKEHGEELALTWMRQRGMYGFQDWDSPASFEEILTALSQLVDLAESPTVVDLASVLMDKLFFSLALNSFQGAFGSTRGRTDTPSLLSARLEPTYQHRA